MSLTINDLQQIRTIVTEVVKDEVSVQITPITTHLDSIEGRFDRIDGRLVSTDGRFDRIDGRLDSMDGRLDSIDGRLTGVENDVKEIYYMVADIQKAGKKTAKRLTIVENTQFNHSLKLEVLSKS